MKLGGRLAPLQFFNVLQLESEMDINWTAVSAISTAIGTIVVAWYTWETHGLRSLSQSQLDVSQKQLDALGASIQPHFLFEFGLTNDPNSLTLTVRNSGGEARHLKVTSNDITCEIPKTNLSNLSGEHQHWKFTAQRESLKIKVDEFRFEVSYEDQHGLKKLQKFKRRGREVEKAV